MRLYLVEIETDSGYIPNKYLQFNVRAKSTEEAKRRAHLTYQENYPKYKIEKFNIWEIGILVFEQ